MNFYLEISKIRITDCTVCSRNAMNYDSILIIISKFTRPKTSVVHNWYSNCGVRRTGIHSLTWSMRCVKHPVASYLLLDLNPFSCKGEIAFGVQKVLSSSTSIISKVQYKLFLKTVKLVMVSSYALGLIMHVVRNFGSLEN